jgi:hypothetical protein
MADGSNGAHGTRERGAALLVALLAAMLLAVLCTGVALTSGTDVMLAANHRDLREAMYAADAAAMRAAADLAQIDDWNAILQGTRRSPFADGPPAGSRTFAPGATIVLDEIVNQANCGRVTACSESGLQAVTADRPWGANNPHWRAFAYGPASNLAASRPGDRPYYLVVLVADDPSENDGDPGLDGSPGTDNPGAGLIQLRAMAFGRRGLAQTVELTIARASALPDATAGDASDDAAAASGDGSEIDDESEMIAAEGAAVPDHIRLLSWRWIR